MSKPDKAHNMETSGLCDRILMRYAASMVKRPYINLIITLVLVIICSVMAFVPPVGQELSDFKEPTKGFLAWGTKISSRYVAFSRIKAVPGLSTLPSNPRSRKRRSVVDFCQTTINVHVDGMSLVYKSSDGSSLYTLENLKSACSLNKKVMENNPNYEAARIRRSNNKPCPSYSLPNIIAMKYGRSSCLHITQNDLDHFSTLLEYCAKFYRTGELSGCLTNNKCTGIPSNCSQGTNRELMYNIFHYLASADFANNPRQLDLLLSVELLLNPYGFDTLKNVYMTVYNNRLKDLSKLKDGNVEIAAFRFNGLRFEVFNSILLKEAGFISLALVLVIAFIWIFSGSIFVALMTFICVLFALLFAYFFYGVIFRLPFFPFLNITTLIFLVGIGADDAFVYIGIWNEAKQLFPFVKGKDFNDYLLQWTIYTLKHALLAMFVTSLTTAAAFYATVTANIVAVKCFSIFAGTSILTNYILMVVLFPVVVIIHEKYLITCTHRCIPTCCSPRIDDEQQQAPADSNSKHCRNNRNISGRRRSGRLLHFISDLIDRVFDQYIPYLTIKLRYILIFIFLGLGIGGLIVIFVKPKLNLPLTQDFQMFSSSNSLEQFTLKYKKSFGFQRSSSGSSRQIIFAFGMEADDTRSAFNPDDLGKAKLKPSFQITSRAEQKWIYNFCSELRKAPFIKTKYIFFCTAYSEMLTTFVGACNLFSSLNSPCCNLNASIDPAVYEYCLKSYLLNRTALQNLIFDKRNQIRGLFFRVTLKYTYKDSFTYNDDMFNEIENWVAPKMKAAPGGYKEGFWTMNYLDFYDLQKALASGTQQSLAIAVAIAFSMVLLTTWNPLLSFYSILSIICVISVTVGTLVLAGWRLNILESIVFSVAAGLSVDFTIHYGVAYRGSPEKSNRALRVKYALHHIGPAVTMGAITTFVTGMAMSPSSTLAYVQMSHFLMLVMFVSWVYATFFFLPLCATIGPTGNFCQLSLNCIAPQQKESERNTLEEQCKNNDTCDEEMLELPPIRTCDRRDKEEIKVSSNEDKDLATSGLHSPTESNEVWKKL